ncbi:hypothetical protein ES703_118912 [subsurface metagenome]
MSSSMITVAVPVVSKMVRYLPSDSFSDSSARLRSTISARNRSLTFASCLVRSSTRVSNSSWAFCSACSACRRCNATDACSINVSIRLCSPNWIPLRVRILALPNSSPLQAKPMAYMSPKSSSFSIARQMVLGILLKENSYRPPGTFTSLPLLRPSLASSSIVRNMPTGCLPKSLRTVSIFSPSPETARTQMLSAASSNEFTMIIELPTSSLNCFPMNS